MKSTGNTAIDHLQCRYLVPTEHPSPDAVRSRLDGVARDHLAGMCGRWLAQLLDPEDPAIWIIRQLNVDLSVDIGSLDDNELAEVWGRQVALGVAHAIAAGADAGGIHLVESGGSERQECLLIPHFTYAAEPGVDRDAIRHYASQAIYVAHFIADLAEGRAWGKWYYRPFDSVSSLSNSAAIRTVITREPESMEEVLLYLGAHRRLEPVLHSLNEYDARSVYKQLLHLNGSEGSMYRVIELALSAWSSAALLSSSGQVATAKNALRLYLAMRLISPEPAFSNISNIVDHLLYFTEILQNVTQPQLLISYLLANDLTSAIQLLSTSNGGSPGGRTLSLNFESLSFLQQVAFADEALLHRIVSTIAMPDVLAHSQGKTDGTVSIVLNTPAGGIFLLLPSLLDLKMHELLKNAPYPPLEAERTTPVLRYLLCLKCLGLLHAQRAEIAHDPVLLLVSGLEEAPSREVFAHLSVSVTAPINAWCQQWLLERLALYHHVEGRYVFVELAQISTSDSILVLRDMRHDSWITASYVAPDARALLNALVLGLASLQKAVEVPVEYLVFGPGFVKLADLDEFHDWPLQAVWTEPDPLPGALAHHLDTVEGEHSATFWTKTPQALPQEMLILFTRYLKRLQPATGDLEYLTLKADGQPLISNRDVDLTWSLVARALLRAFARRLVGLDQSSIAYLYQNVLAGTSTVYLRQEQVEVQLASCPLHIILRMAGVNGQTYVLPWLNDTVVTLELSC